MGDEAGLLRLGAGVFAAIIGIGAVAWGTGAGAGEARGGDGPGSGEPGSRAVAPAAAGPAAAEADPAPAKGGGGRACRVEGAPSPLPDAVHEASGLALGRRGPGVLWTHGDSGDPRLVAVSVDGTVLGTVRVAGATAGDWEDISAGPCAAGSCLYVGDIGDNDASRPRITVYRLPEPAPRDGTSAPAEALHATYPDGPHDAEALFVDAGGRIHVVTKGESGPVAVYRYPESPRPGAESRLERVAELSPGKVGRDERITGADVSADGRWVALRTLRTVAFHPFAAVTSGGSGGEPVRFDLSAANEAQGEGIALGTGGVVYLASEGGKKKNSATLVRVTCPVP
jgi:hypothetical protein